ncbi:radical SAM/SPASM domain-containing protein [Owenweeksia hongkongensis]|uniref:radical SAM/SPASM domain-containing protein n=1 Tax=Owenweeksia hongkongensis TaxID=253245 RepID=UPI003A94C165
MSELKRKFKSLAADKPLIWKAIKKGQELKYNYQYQRYYGKFKTETASITEINLEFCSNCNLRCKFCALDHLKPKTYMSLKVLDTLFENLLHENRFERVKTINLYNGGETLMHPNKLKLFERIKYYQTLFKAMDRSFPKIVLLTNGMLLRSKLAREILILKVLDEVGFSLDGGSPEAFEDLRVNAKWEKFSRNVKDFINLKKDLHPECKTFGISIVMAPHPLNDTWMHPEFREITQMLDSVEYRRLHDWGGQVDIGEKQKVNKKGCDLLMKQMVILPNGDVSVCCNDLNSEGVVGNILKDSLYDVYKGQQRLRYVHFLHDGRKDDLDLCKNCVSF